MAKRNTKTPIPPIQCVKQRQKLPVLDIVSTSVRIEAPVVVKPEIVSNRASVKLLISPENTNGSAPIILNIIQLSATVTKPSFA